MRVEDVRKALERSALIRVVRDHGDVYGMKIVVESGKRGSDKRVWAYILYDDMEVEVIATPWSIESEKELCQGIYESYEKARRHIEREVALLHSMGFEYTTYHGWRIGLTTSCSMTIASQLMSRDMVMMNISMNYPGRNIYNWSYINKTMKQALSAFVRNEHGAFEPDTFEHVNALPMKMIDALIQYDD